MDERYARQIVMKEIGKGQSKLLKSTAAIVGLGALGSHSAELLARAGVGELILIDRDYVELSNLQRQTMYTEEDIDIPKAIAAKHHIENINSEINVKTYIEDFNHKNAEDLMKNVDIALDGSDNLETRFLINDISVKNKIPWLYGAIIGTEATSFNIIPGKACFRCLIPELPASGSLETCEISGVLNTLAPVIAGRHVSEAIKILLGNKCSNKFFRINLWTDKFELLNVSKNKNCVCCGKKKFEFLKGKKSPVITKICGVNTFQVLLKRKAIALDEMAKKLKKSQKISANNYMIHFSIGGKRISLFKDGRVIVKGVKNENEAKSICNKYIS